MQSVMDGVYPAPGATIEPGIAFTHAAVRHAARRAQGGEEPTRVAG